MEEYVYLVSMLNCCQFSRAVKKELQHRSTEEAELRQQNAELERHLICARHDLKDSQRRLEIETEQRLTAEKRAQKAEGTLNKYQSAQSSDSLRQQQMADKNNQLEKQVNCFSFLITSFTLLREI